MPRYWQIEYKEGSVTQTPGDERDVDVLPRQTPLAEYVEL